MIIFAAFFSTVSWFVRYRYLNMYARLPPEPQRKEPDIDLFPDTHEEGTKSGLSSYLDEFLSAIKIFGYLERPVFHELTRSMMTRKLIAGETLDLEEEKGFCIVVDGLVEIFVKSSGPGQRRNTNMDSRRGPSLETASSDDDDEPPAHGNQRYQLLTEVRNGAPMSSLFSLMSLFTEDINLRVEDDSAPATPAMSSRPNVSRPPASASFRGPQDSRAPYSKTSVFSTDGITAEPAETADASGQRSAAGSGLPHVPPMTLDPPRPQRPIPRRMTTNSVHPDIIARATVDTTIAIIPASAFRRLIRIYPKATSHIVHVILSRFQRVTLATAYNYLGLSEEVLQTEENMIKYTMCQLPNLLRGDALERLKEKFHRERERIGEDETDKGIALHNPAAGRRKRSATTLRKEAALHSLARQRPSSAATSFSIRSQDHSSPSSNNPGDLLANTALNVTSGNVDLAAGSLSSLADPPFGSDPFQIEGSLTMSPLAQRSFNPFAAQKQNRMSIDSREGLDEENVFRESVLECMFKAIGLDSSTATPRESESIEASPRLGSYDTFRQRPTYNSNAFGFMDPFGGSADGDAESMTSGGATTNTPPSVQTLAHDMVDEAEIVFFPKGSVLVEQGERNPGLYYVIDGFLDVCMPAGAPTSSDILQSASAAASGQSPSPFSADVDPFGSRLNKPAKQTPLGQNGAAKPSGKKKAKSARRSVALIKPGGLAGYIGTVSSYRSFIDVVAKTDVYVGFLPRASLERIVDRYPIVLLTMAKRLTNILPRLILHIDFALEWLQVNAGQVIFHKNEESEAIYIVLNGRLRLVDDRKEGRVGVLAEFGQGESVGELEVLTESSRSGTLHAIRDTELVKFPRTLFNSLAQEHPNITIKISKIIASRMRNLMENPAAALSLMDGKATNSIEKGSSTDNLRTVAILPVTAGVPIVEFGDKLMNALGQVGTPNGATSLNQAAILNHLGKHAFNKMGKLKLSQYLADLEEKYSLVVYVAGKITFVIVLLSFFWGHLNPTCIE